MLREEGKSDLSPKAAVIPSLLWYLASLGSLLSASFETSFRWFFYLTISPKADQGTLHSIYKS